MNQLIITLPSSYIIDPLFNTFNSGDWASILDLIRLISKSQSNEIIEALDLICKFSPQVITQDEYKKEFDTSNNTSESKKESEPLNESESESSAMNMSLACENEKLKTMVKMLSAEQSTRDAVYSMAEKFEPILRLCSGTNKEKGRLGEELIYSIITQDMRYQSAIVEIVGEESHCGDIHMQWDHVKCLIEVKNKATITSADINKFVSDIDRYSTRINCALFISLATDKLPGKSREMFQIEVVRDITVCYTYLSSADMVHYPLACFHKLLIARQNKTSLEKTLCDGFKAQYERAIHLHEYFKSAITQKNKELASLGKELNHCAENLKVLSITNDSIMKIHGTEKPPVDFNTFYIERLLKNKIVHREQVLQEFTSEEIESLGGYEVAIESAVHKYCLSLITENAINAIRVYFSTFKKLPAKKYLEDNNYIPSGITKKISSVIHFKKFLEKVIKDNA